MDLKPGEELKVTGYVSYSTGTHDISDLVQLPINRLAELEKASIAAEKAICTQISDKVSEWSGQAVQTVRIRHAKDYLRTPIAEHTSNCWVEDGDWHRISNMVYKMSWHSYERSSYRYSGSSQKVNDTIWELTWEVSFNAPYCPPLMYSSRTIAGQSQKTFSSKADMEKYLQGRIAAYADLFTEISPPIPKEDQKYFCIHGLLLPGYTVEDPDALKPNEAELDDLLSLLDDAEIGGEAPAPPSEPQSEEKSPQAIWEKHRKKRTGGSQRQQPPAR